MLLPSVAILAVSFVEQIYEFHIYDTNAALSFPTLTLGSVTALCGLLSGAYPLLHLVNLVGFELLLIANVHMKREIPLSLFYGKCIQWIILGVGTWIDIPYLGFVTGGLTGLMWKPQLYKTYHSEEQGLSLFLLLSQMFVSCLLLVDSSDIYGKMPYCISLIILFSTFLVSTWRLYQSYLWPMEHGIQIW